MEGNNLFTGSPMFQYNIAESEQLVQGKFDYWISELYHYILIGDANVSQLKKAGILPNKSYKGLEKNKPDGIILQGKNDVKVLVEYKQPGKFNNKMEAKNIITDWYYKLAEKVGCKIICATDGKQSYWFSVKTKDEIKYSDDDKSYDFVLDISRISSDEIDYNRDLSNAVSLLETIDDTGYLSKIKEHNPQNLAKNVWQKIWITTGKQPEQCLYNVVEIFVFKYLSDLFVLDEDYSFNKIYRKSQENAVDALKYYADNVRDRIKTLFPRSDKDGTTIINGTIFVNENGKANVSQAVLFKDVLSEFYDYGQEFGTFLHIDKNFKTRLYENFLRRTAGISSMGQYFTPRNVVKSIISMAKVHKVSQNASICDPFCGVGGFLLEYLNNNPEIKKEFEPKNGKIEPTIKLLGFDKGSDEKDDQRTIILAKANMLIYMSDIIAKYKDSTEEFSRKVFNEVFHLIKSNVGTFGVDDYKDNFDLILTNPPYVTSGVSIIKKEIEERGLKRKMYEIPCTGLEGLALEWIMYSLKPGGTAFVIIPDGLMKRQNDAKLRELILRKCVLNAIITLPTRTFFATPQDTYILSLTKKANVNMDIDDYNVFTYIVSEIGETRDSNRFALEQNDLIKASLLYKQFMVGKEDFETLDRRCKIQNISRFINNKWAVISDWSDDEKRELGIEIDDYSIQECDFNELTSDLVETIQKTVKQANAIDITNLKYKVLLLSDIGTFKRGDSKYTKKYCREHSGQYPVFSSNTKGDMSLGFIESFDYETECIRVTTNGHYAGTVNYIKKQRFSMNSDCGIFRLKEEYENSVSYKYLEYVLRNKRVENGYNWQNKALPNSILQWEVKMPIDKNGKIDRQMQELVVQKYNYYLNIKQRLIREMKYLSSVNIDLDDESV